MLGHTNIYVYEMKRKFAQDLFFVKSKESINPVRYSQKQHRLKSCFFDLFRKISLKVWRWESPDWEADDAATKKGSDIQMLKGFAGGNERER
jgi:hypothetical protein